MEEKLTEWNLGEFIEKFQDENITVDMFPNLAENAETLKELLPKVGDRLNFVRKVHEYQSQLMNNDYSEGGEESMTEKNQEAEGGTTSQDIIFEVDNSLLGSFCSSSTPVFDTLEKLDTEAVPNKKPRTINNFIEDFNLKQLLNETAVGRALISWYEVKGWLDSTRQSYLVDIISTDILNKNITHLSSSEYEIVSKKIVELFPSEITESYYLPPIRKRDSLDRKSGVAKGKLVDKFRNKLTFLREAGILPTRSDRESHSSKEDAQCDTDNEHLKWLRHNREPAKDVYYHWDAIFTLRRENLLREGGCSEELFEEYPILKGQICLNLVERDFEKIFPNKADCLLNSWDSVVTKLIKLRGQFVTAESDKILLDLLGTETLHEGYKHYIMLMLLASLLPNKSKHVYGKTRKHWRPTIVDSRNGIVLRAELPGDIETKIKQKTEKLASLDITVQPFVVVEGSGTVIRNVYVSINGQLYSVPSVLKGIDICFKVYHVFHLSYQVESEHIWHFLQYAIYDVKSKWDKPIPYILDITNKIKKL